MRLGSSAALAAALFLSVGPARPQEPGTGVRIASWNIGGLSQPDDRKTLHALSVLASANDVIALQEAPSTAGAAANNSVEIADGWRGVFESSNAILTRWPILQSGLIAANPSWARNMPWADIQPPNGAAFRVYSIHLTYRRGVNPFLAQAREVETRRILIHARRFDGPVVLAGDFNTIGWIVAGHDAEPAVRLLRTSGYLDALGSDGGSTHALLGRLDWIFASGFSPRSASLGEYEGSDHRWLRAELGAGDDVPQTSVPEARSRHPILSYLFALLALAGLIIWRRRRASRRASQ